MKDLFKNCLSVSEDDGWFTPLRFTDNQLSAYGVTDALRIRGAAPSSVCLAFRSKAKKLPFEYDGRQAQTKNRTADSPETNEAPEWVLLIRKFTPIL